MIERRKFIKVSALTGLAGLVSGKVAGTDFYFSKKGQPIVISTWDAGIAANKAAWQVLSTNGSALDAVEKGVMVTESSQNCCVGLGANPDRDGYVTLDASIMDENFNCFLERIKHPISVARRVMEKTPHVMLVGAGAQQFAIAEGFPLEAQKLSEQAQENYDNWLKKSEYKSPAINVEKTKEHGPFAPAKLDNGEWNHDTIGMIAMDFNGNLSGSCVATGQGEDVIRVAGSHSVVEMMRQGISPEAACKKIIQRIIKIKKEKAKDIQVAFIALNKNGQHGSFAIHPGFEYALRNTNNEKLVKSKSWFNI